MSASTLDPADRLALLVDHYLDGVLSSGESAELHATLLGDATQRDLFVQLLVSDRALAEAHRSDRQVTTPPADLADLAQPRLAPAPSRIPFPRLALAAALLLAACGVAIVTIALNNPQPEIRNPKSTVPVATLIDAAGTVVVNDDIANPGSDYTAGVYSIASGSADLLLTNQVAVALQGNTSLILHSDMLATVTRGTVTFDCPPGTEGFTVHLPDGSHLVDVGTRFVVSVDADHRPHVGVIDGHVDVFHRGATRRLATGDGVELAADRIDDVDADTIHDAIGPARLAQRLRLDGDDKGLSVGDQVQWTDGAAGRSARFGAVGGVGSGESIVVPQDQAFDPGAESFSIAFWVARDHNDRPTPDNPDDFDGVIDAMRNTISGYGILFDRNDRLSFYTSAAPSERRPDRRPLVFRSLRAIDDTEFHHFVVTVDRADRRVTIYIDGELDATEPIAGLDAADRLSPSQDLWIGTQNDGVGRGLDGRLADMRFYHGVAVPSQVRWLAVRSPATNPLRPPHAAVQ